MRIEDMPTRERIILATINCIGRDGIQSLTIRKIAKEAGVNSAAINYYFRSKENLMDQALKQTLDEMSGLPEEIFDAQDIDPHDRLQAFFEAIMEGIFNYPGITTAHIYGPLMRNDYNSYFVRRFNAFLDDLLSKIKRIKKNVKEDDLKMAIVQILSAIILPALMPKLFRGSVRLNFTDAEMRRSYVDNLVDHFFK